MSVLKNKRIKIFIAPTENFVLEEKSEIVTDVSAGNDATLVLENNQGFVENDYVVVKTPGKEQSHICKINAVVSGNTDIQVDTLKHALKEGDVAQKILYNQRKFYGCETEDGTFVEIVADGSPKDIEVDNPNGTILEYTGSTYLYFKATYYNSTTTSETVIADAKAILGSESNRYCSIYAIKRQAGLVENPYVSDVDIERKREAAENEIDSAIGHLYSLPLSEIPALIENTTVLLAAGYLDYQEFGSESGGVKWLGEARGILKNIEKGTRRLLGSDKAELTRLSGGRLKGYPDSDCEDEDCDRIFSVEDEY